GRSLRQDEFHAFLRRLRASYPGRTLWLVLDKHGSHAAPGTLRLAQRLDIGMLWLPKQWSELNAMDHLWKAVKGDISANRQYETVDRQAEGAEQYIWGLTPTQ